MPPRPPSVLDLVDAVVSQTWVTFPLASALAVAAQVGFGVQRWQQVAGDAVETVLARHGSSLRRGGTPDPLGGEDRRLRLPSPEFIAPAALFLLVSVIGCDLGGLRYYLHYLTQYVPALAVLGAHPAAWRWMFALPRRSASRAVAWAARLPAWYTLLVVVYCAVDDVRLAVGLAASRLDTVGATWPEEIGEAIRRTTSKEETIYAWGWMAWPVYYYADRRAPIPVYKQLGQVTTFNTNGLLTPSGPILFRPGTAADAVVEGLRVWPPAYVVRARPYFPNTDDPLEDFLALREILEQRYVVRRETDEFMVYERRGREGAAAAAPVQPPPP